MEENRFSDSGIIRCFTLKGVKQHTFWTPQYSSLLRFETEGQLECLRTILGDATTVGARMRRPKINTYNTPLPFTKLNVIVGSENQQLPIRIDSINDRIDFFLTIMTLILSFRLMSIW
jgi:hypothetical protein